MFYISIAHTCQVSDGHLDDAIAVDELTEERLTPLFFNPALQLRTFKGWK